MKGVCVSMREWPPVSNFFFQNLFCFPTFLFVHLGPNSGYKQFFWLHHRYPNTGLSAENKKQREGQGGEEGKEESPTSPCLFTEKICHPRVSSSAALSPSLWTVRSSLQTFVPTCQPSLFPHYLPVRGVPATIQRRRAQRQTYRSGTFEGKVILPFRTLWCQQLKQFSRFQSQRSPFPLNTPSWKARDVDKSWRTRFNTASCVAAGMSSLTLHFESILKR